jgi:hypothetical protein
VHARFEKRWGKKLIDVVPDPTDCRPGRRRKRTRRRGLSHADLQGEARADYPMAMPESSAKKKEKRYPTVCIPVSPEIIAALEVGGEVEVTLKGTVRGLESRQSPTTTRTQPNELRVELRVVDAEPGEGATTSPTKKSPT